MSRIVGPNWENLNLQQTDSDDTGLLARHSIGALALLIFVKQDIRSSIEDVTKSEAGFGPLFMSNKGQIWWFSSKAFWRDTE